MGDEALMAATRLGARHHRAEHVERHAGSIERGTGARAAHRRLGPHSAPPPPVPAPKPTANALEKAREAALRGEPAAVRQLLEQKVRSGHGTAEEANLVRQACKAMGDRACSDDVKSKYP